MNLDPEDNLLLQVHEPEQTAEFFRLTVTRLRELGLHPTPLNYALFYTYVSGVNAQLNERLDALIASNEFNHDTAITLLPDYLISFKTTAVEEIRKQVLTTISESLKKLSQTTGKTHQSNERIEEHLNHLQETEMDEDVSKLLNDIIHITGDLLNDSRELENELKESSENLETLREELFIARNEAMTDALTGLHNRLSLDSKLEILISERRYKSLGFSMLMTDIDHFKDINDSYGHLIGDKVLKAFAKLLESKTRDTDFVARFGGEEFIILLPHTTLNNAFKVAENMRTSIEKMKIKTGGNNGKNMHSLTASFGVAIHRGGETAEQLIDRCDKALYRAKNAGRNRSMIAQ